MRTARVLLLLACAHAAPLTAAAPEALPDHGGRYAGPGDLVPPNGGSATAPTPPTGPTGPQVPRPGTGPTGSTTPAQPTLPGVGPTHLSPQPGKGVTPGRASGGTDLTAWTIWWEFNKDRYLNLKNALAAVSAETDVGGILTGLNDSQGVHRASAPGMRTVRTQVLPTLLETLAREERNVDLVSSTLVALAKIGDASLAFEPIRQHLKHPNQEIAESAALALGILRSPEAIPLLVALLGDAPEGRSAAGRPSGVPERTRAYAAYALALIGRAAADEAMKDRIAQVLLAELRNGSQAVQDARAACVIGLGILDLADPHPLVAELDALLRRRQESRLVRAHAPGAMAKLLGRDRSADPQSAQAVSLFLALLQDSGTETEVRASCVQALGRMARGDAPYADAILEGLTHTALKGRNLGEKNLTAISLAYLASGCVEETRAAQAAIEFLVRQMDKGPSAYQPWCGLALGIAAFRLRTNDATLHASAQFAVHREFLEAKNLEEKAAYALALGLMRFESAADEIDASIAEHADPTYRGYAALALGLMDARKHQDHLSRLLAGSRRLPALLRQAAIGLGLLRDRETLPRLLEILSPPDGSRPALSVLGAAASAVGFVGDARALPLLSAILRDRQTAPLSRAFAAAALGMVADAGPLPWSEPIGADVNYLAALPTLADFTTGLGVLDIL